MKFSLNKKGSATYIGVLKKRLKYITDETAGIMMDKLYKNTPKITGKLARSYRVKENKDGIHITNDAGYVQFVNNGTIYQKGQHFIERSLNETERSIEKIAKKSQKINK